MPVFLLFAGYECHIYEATTDLLTCLNFLLLLLYENEIDHRTSFILKVNCYGVTIVAFLLMTVAKR